MLILYGEFLVVPSPIHFPRFFSILHFFYQTANEQKLVLLLLKTQHYIHHLHKGDYIDQQLSKYKSGNITLAALRPCYKVAPNIETIMGVIDSFAARGKTHWLAAYTSLEGA